MKEIKARNGYYLTQSAEVADENRIFVTAIKGVDINESDWREATKEDKKAYEAECERRAREDDEKIIENRSNN